MTTSTARVTLKNRENNHTAAQHDIDISLVSKCEAPRKKIERFIQCLFRHAYDARINHFPLHLLSMCQDGKILAALGLRPAMDNDLFLEAYLDRPIENIIAEKTLRPIDRNRIIEISSLASSHAGGARALIITLTAYLSGASYEWAVFTTTLQVRNNFTKLGIELIPLANADQNRLGDSQQQWGSYYQQSPIVVACDVRQSFPAVLKALESENLFPTAHQLWNNAIEAGRLGCLRQPPRTLDSRWAAWTLPKHVKHTDDNNIV